MHHKVHSQKQIDDFIEMYEKEENSLIKKMLII
jgi:hypothetical protein